MLALKAVGLAIIVLEGGVAIRERRRSSQHLTREAIHLEAVPDVPIYNYDLRHLQYDGAVMDTESTEFDWVVMFKGGAGNEQLVEFCEGPLGSGVCKARGNPGAGGVPFVTVRATEKRLVQLLETHEGEVEFAEVDVPVFVIPELPQEQQAQSQNALWGHDTIKLDETSKTGKGVHIYVMDTGVRTSHDDFGGRAIPTIDTIAGGGEPVECNGDPSCGKDTHGHGTHCAGTAAGRIHGAAKEATIHAMRVCCGSGTNTLAGLDWIATKGERPGLVTMSLGSYGQNMASKTAVDKVVSKGISVFVSAGNNNIDSCRKTYAFIPSTITVGASDQSNKRASFSNFGSCNDIYAPGVSILSANHTDDKGTRYMSGTSMATPLAAGVGALILEEHPNYSPAQLKAELSRRATKGALTGMKAGDPNELLSAV